MQTSTRFPISHLLLSRVTELTLADRRLYNYLLHHAIDRLKKKLCFSIALTELAGVYGTGDPSAERLKESLPRLMRTLIEFNSASGHWIVLPLLESAVLDSINNQLTYTYSPYCRELFFDAYTLEKCLIQAHFNQKYANLLYEILADTFYSKQNQLIIELTDLRSRLHLPLPKLTNFGDFNRFALSPALAEINAYASFAVKFHTQRKGMKVVQVIFDMREKRALTTGAHTIIPPKRPRLFIDNPAVEQAYAFLLNAETKERRKYFTRACKRAQKAQQPLDEEVFDRPDLWFKWVEKDFLR